VNSAETQERIYRMTIENLQAERDRLSRELDENRNPDGRSTSSTRDSRQVQTDLDIGLLLRSAQKALDQSDALTFLNGLLQQEVRLLDKGTPLPWYSIIPNDAHVMLYYCFHRRIRMRHVIGNSSQKARKKPKRWKIV
jgi:hypothetical protein